jgi:hypothetical protein
LTELRWYDRRTGKPIEVTWTQPGAGPERFAGAIARGAVPVRTLGQILTGYLDQPEHKSLAPDGLLSTGTTAGLLLRRPVGSAPALTDLTGKEGTKLIERATGEITDPSEYRVRYGERVDRWTALVVPVLPQMGPRR